MDTFDIHMWYVDTLDIHRCYADTLDIHRYYVDTSSGTQSLFIAVLKTPLIRTSRCLAKQVIASFKTITQHKVVEAAKRALAHIIKI